MGVDPAEHRSRVAAWSGYRQLLVAALLSGLVLSMAPVAAGGETYVPPTATTTLPDGPPAALPVTQPDRLGTDTNVYGSGVVRSSPSGMVAQSGGSSAGVCVIRRGLVSSPMWRRVTTALRTSCV